MPPARVAVPCRRIVTSAGATAALMVAAAPLPAAGAPPPCAPRDATLAMLAEQFGARPIAAALMNGALVEVLATEDGRTWTIIVTRPGGPSCLAASGTDWQALARGRES